MSKLEKCIERELLLKGFTSVPRFLQHGEIIFCALYFAGLLRREVLKQPHRSIQMGISLTINIFHQYAGRFTQKLGSNQKKCEVKVT